MKELMLALLFIIPIASAIDLNYEECVNVTLENGTNTTYCAPANINQTILNLTQSKNLTLELTDNSCLVRENDNVIDALSRSLESASVSFGIDFICPAAYDINESLDWEYYKATDVFAGLDSFGKAMIYCQENQSYFAMQALIESNQNEGNREIIGEYRVNLNNTASELDKCQQETWSLENDIEGKEDNAMVWQIFGVMWMLLFFFVVVLYFRERGTGNDTRFF